MDVQGLKEQYKERADGTCYAIGRFALKYDGACIALYTCIKSMSDIAALHNQLIDDILRRFVAVHTLEPLKTRGF